MNIEKFLGFWSGHNTLIIELLIAAVLLSIIYLAFRTFFGDESEISNSSKSSGMNPEDLQRTLQKIIETQSHPAGASSAPTSPAATGAAAATSGVDSAQIEKLKVEVQDREKTIQGLKEQVQQLGANQGAASAAASKELESKVKDLEARLSEYEIISEDIADITFYKEENTRLQKELTIAKSGGAGPSAAPAASTPPPQAPPPVVESAAPAPEPVAPAPVAPVPEAAPAPAAETPAVAAPPPEPAVSAPAPEPSAPAAEANSAVPDLGPIDDDLMKEFASAVEEQKAASAAAKNTAGGNEKAAKSDKPVDNQNLMGEFENFMKKG